MKPTIEHVLRRIRYARSKSAPTPGDDFKIPLEWRHVPGMDFALIHKDHAKLISSAHGRPKLGSLMFIRNPDNYLGIGDKNQLAMMPWQHEKDTYFIRHERRDWENPVHLPTHIDLTKYIKAPEPESDIRPSEMMPEDYHMY